MAYSFTNLSFADFEDLMRDLLGAEFGMRFESFGAGPDGGMDGRHAIGANTTVLQAKHYGSSTLSALKAEMRRARPQIDALASTRYLLATSRSLSPPAKAELSTIIGPSLKAESDIFGARELNDLLRKHPEIEKANIKLWLASTAVLERVIHASGHNFTAVTRQEIEERLRIYAPNPSFKAALDKLEATNIVIIAGPPGVGKTTLAQMLAYAYIADGWEYVAIRSLDDGFAKLHDKKRQIFFFDDFLGTASLDTRALAANDNDFARFFNRVRNSTNARFILTTRAPIFEEARRASDRLADKRLDMAKYMLDVGLYTRRIKARILYNHIAASPISIEHIQALLSSGAVPKIVDHPNYNPRIVEAMTDQLRLRDVAPADYAGAFIKALDNPLEIWDVAFRKGITDQCQHLLVSLFFASDYGVSIDELRMIFDALHRYLCAKYTIPHGPKDFEEALKVLEGGFVAIDDQTVRFINPSLRDYLGIVIDDVEQVADYAAASPKADWASRLWHHVRIRKLWSPTKQKHVAGAFRRLAERFKSIQRYWREKDSKLTVSDLPYSQRIPLLLSWALCAEDIHFADLALELAEAEAEYKSWDDGTNIVELLAELADEDGDYATLEHRAALHDQLEQRLIAMVTGPVWADDLESIFASVEEHERWLSRELIDAVETAMSKLIDNIGETVGEVDSESTLNDHIQAVTRFASRLGTPAHVLERAVEKIEERIAVVQADDEDTHAPSFSAAESAEPDRFDDDALASLFEPLVHGLR